MDLSTVRFGTGHHKPTATPTGNRDMCVMEAVAFMAGEPWSAAPKCASPVISSFLRTWNDALSDEDRDRLLPADKWVPRLVGSCGDDATEERRAYLALDWLVRVHTPAWFDLVPSLVPHAAALRALPEVVDLSSAKAAGEVVSAARDAAGAAARAVAGDAALDAAGDAAGAAAGAAAWDAAGTAVLDAAWAAAWTAAGAAARDAAGTAAGDAARAAVWDAAGAAARAVAGAALRPTVETLQQSALDLLDRMLACGEHPRAGGAE